MSVEPKPKQQLQNLLGHFERSGDNTLTHQLIKAVYNENVDLAQKIVKADPDQINTQDPFAGLTPLHIAIFWGNRSLVSLIANHPVTDFNLKDNFERRVVDMLDYTIDQYIFKLIMDRTYPDLMRAVESEEYEKGMSSGVIKPLKPE